MIQLSFRSDPHPDFSEVDDYGRVPLRTLQSGDRFRSDNYEGGWTWGTVLFVNPSRVRVILAGHQKQVIFATKDDGGVGYRTFEADGRSEVNWPREVPVYLVQPDSPDDPDERSSMTTEDKVAQATGLQARYDFQLKALVKAEGASDTGKVEVAKARIVALEKEAAEKGISLKSPDASGVTTIAAKGPQKVAAKVAAPKGTFDKATVKDGKAVKAPKKEEKAKTTHDCLCACGAETGGLYRPGHDAKVKGILTNIERGKLPKDAVPEPMKAFVKFKGNWGKDGFAITHAPVKFPGREDIISTRLQALEALDV